MYKNGFFIPVEAITKIGNIECTNPVIVRKDGMNFIKDEVLIDDTVFTICFKIDGQYIHWYFTSKEARDNSYDQLINNIYKQKD